MPMPNWVRIARMKAEAEKTRAAQQALVDPDRGGDHHDPILLSFQRWRLKHPKHLELIASETSPTNQTGKPQLPRRWSVTNTGPGLIEVTTTLIPWSKLPARHNRYRETSRQRELLPSRV